MKGKQERKILGSLQSLQINISPVKDSFPSFIQYTSNLCLSLSISLYFLSSFIPSFYFWVYFSEISASFLRLWFTALFAYFSLSLTLSTDSPRLPSASLSLSLSIDTFHVLLLLLFFSPFFILSTFSRKCVFLIFPSLLFPHPSSNSLPTMSTLLLFVYSSFLPLSQKGIKISVLVAKEKSNTES